jgi:hypothetical protein
MHLPDFDELFDPDFDPDLLDKKLWAEVPEPIRKIVEQHVAAHISLASRNVGEASRHARRRNSYRFGPRVLPFWRRHGHPKPLPTTAQ